MMRVVFVVLLVGLLAGCTQTQTFERNGFAVELTGSPIEPGGRVTLEVTFTLEEPLTYNHPGCGPDLFSAQIEYGESGIDLGEYGTKSAPGPCVVRETTLQPGSHEAVFHWNGRDGAMHDDRPHSGDRVASGSFDVLVELRGDAGRSITVPVEVS